MRFPADTNGHFIYDECPELYDLIHSAYDYPRQSLVLCSLLNSEGISDGSRVVEAACGTGSYLVHLAARFDVSGFDRSAAMLGIARSKLPGRELNVADLRQFRVEPAADALLCLCSAIAYLRSIPELEEACRAFSRALRPGGVLVLRPWLTPEQAVDGLMWMDSYDGRSLKICRQAVLRRRNSLSVLEFHWLVTRPETGVEHHIDRHELYLFRAEQIARALEDARFDARRVAVGGFAQDLWVAHRRAVA